MSAAVGAIWGIAAAATAGVILRPRRWPEWMWAVAGAVLLVVLGLVSLQGAGAKTAAAGIAATAVLLIAGDDPLAAGHWEGEDVSSRRFLKVGALIMPAAPAAALLIHVALG